jgi:hypothetical protein
MDTNNSTISIKTCEYYKCQYGRVELLNDENYPDWSNTVKFFLTADKTWSIVVGTEVAPRAPPANAAVARREEYRTLLLEFQARSAKACSMIISSVSSSYKQFLFGKTNPKDMWDTLKRQLDSLTSNSGPFIRRDQFLNERHSGKVPISTFFAKLQQYQAQLASTRLPISDFELMSHVLKGDTLDSRFKATVKTLRLQLDTLTWNNLTQILINEDLQQAADAVTKANASALISNSNSKKPFKGKGRSKGQDKSNQQSDSKRSNRGRNSNRSSRKRNRSPSLDSGSESDNDHRRHKRARHSKRNSSNDITCYYCLKKGHVAPDCRTKKKAEELQQQRQRQSGGSNANITNSHEEPRAYPHISDSTVLACTTLTATRNLDYQHSWHLDSGATDHIANDRKTFTQIRRLATPIGIRLGDDKVIWAYEKGTVRFQTLSLDKSQFRDIIITDVLYAKDLGTNLISTRRLGLKGCKTVLNPYDQGADVFDKNGDWLGTADIVRGMYCLRILKVIGSS